MSLVAEQMPEPEPLSEIHESTEPGSVQPDPGDGTRQLLQSGGGTLATGILAALLILFVFGGIGPQGPHTNTGWLLLIIVLMCLPFGFLLSLLGVAKWFRNRRLSSR